MCGIFGVAAKGLLTGTELSFLYQASIVGVVRGSDGFGMFGVDAEKNINAIKAAGIPQNILYSDAFREFSTWVDKKATLAVGHHRSATKGTVNDQNAHPFHHGHITMVHNGTLTSGVDMQKYQVDSEGICAAIAEKGVEAFATLYGAYACVWWDQKDECLHFFKNDERPLSIVKFRGSYFWASEYGMLEWLLRRTHAAYNEKDVTIYKLIANKEYFIGKDVVLKEAKETIKKYYPPTTTFHQADTTTAKWLPNLTRQEKREIKRLRQARAKGDDKAVTFYLFTEDKLYRTDEKQRQTYFFRYAGYSDRQEPVFVDSPHRLSVGWQTFLWQGIIVGTPKFNAVRGVSDSIPSYEVDFDSLVTEDDDIDDAALESSIVYPYRNHYNDTGSYYYTLNNKTVSSYNIGNVLSKGCACCEVKIEEKDVPNSLGMGQAGSGVVTQLICPKCTHEEVRL